MADIKHDNGVSLADIEAVYKMLDEALAATEKDG